LGSYIQKNFGKLNKQQLNYINKLYYRKMFEDTTNFNVEHLKNEEFNKMELDKLFEIDFDTKKYIGTADTAEAYEPTLFGSLIS
jgi:hypothetical protein